MYLTGIAKHLILFSYADNKLVNCTTEFSLVFFLKGKQQFCKDLYVNRGNVWILARPMTRISAGTFTNHVYTHAVPGVFLSWTHTIVTPEPYRLGELQTKSSFCLLLVNPIGLLAGTQLHYYLPTA